MKRSVYRFFLAVFAYWLVATLAGQVLDIPEKIFGITAFVPPVLGLMWGLPAALGVCVGGLFALPELQNVGETGVVLYFVRAGWIFLAAYLPVVLWRRWHIFSEKPDFALGVHTLQKFLAVMLVTFVATSAFRALTATPAELEIASNWLGSGKTMNFLATVVFLLGEQGICFS